MTATTGAARVGRGSAHATSADERVRDPRRRVSRGGVSAARAAGRRTPGRRARSAARGRGSVVIRRRPAGCRRRASCGPAEVHVEWFLAQIQRGWSSSTWVRRGRVQRAAAPDPGDPDRRVDPADFLELRRAGTVDDVRWSRSGSRAHEALVRDQVKSGRPDVSWPCPATRRRWASGPRELRAATVEAEPDNSRCRAGRHALPVDPVGSTRSTGRDDELYRRVGDVVPRGAPERFGSVRWDVRAPHGRPAPTESPKPRTGRAGSAPGLELVRPGAGRRCAGRRSPGCAGRRAVSRAARLTGGPKTSPSRMHDRAGGQPDADVGHPACRGRSRR